MTRLDEKGMADAVKSFVSDKMSGVKDAALATLGSDEAEGRLLLGKITQSLVKEWTRYVGMAKKAGRDIDRNQPSLEQICDFLYKRFGVDVDPEYVAGLADGSIDPSGEDMEDAKVSGDTNGDPEAEETTDREEEASGEEGGEEKEVLKPDEDIDAAKVASQIKDVLQNGDKGDVEDAMRRIQQNLHNKEFAKVISGLRNDIDRASVKHQLEPVTGNAANAQPAKKDDDPRKEKLRQIMSDHIKNNESFVSDGSMLLEDGNPSITQIFTKIAFALYDAGMVTVKGADGKTYGNQYGNKDGGEEGIHSDVISSDYEIAGSGYYIDMGEMNERLKHFGIARGDIAHMKSIVSSGSVIKIVDGMSTRERLMFVQLAGAFSMGLKKSRSEINAQDNMSSNGNTIDFNRFKDQISKSNIPARDIKAAVIQLRSAASDNKIDKDELNSLLGGDLKSDTSHAIVGIVKSICGSISKVEKKQQQEE